MVRSKRIKVKTVMIFKNFIKYFILISLALFFLFPVVFMFVSSLKTNEMQVVSDMSSFRGFIPYGALGIKNYINVFREMNFGRFMFNSLFITSVTVLAGMVFNSMLAFSLARLHFKGQRFIVSIVVALMIIPIESVVIPMLLMVNIVGWIDSYQVQIFPFIAEPFFIFLFYQFFIGIPYDFDEAAVVDGATPSMIYSRIIVPLSRPVFASVLILQSMFRWNEFLWPLMVTQGPKYRPLTVAMQQFFSQDPKLWGEIFAFASMVTLPLLILFLFFQKWFIQSVASSGIKG